MLECVFFQSRFCLLHQAASGTVYIQDGRAFVFEARKQKLQYHLIVQGSFDIHLLVSVYNAISPRLINLFILIW